MPKLNLNFDVRLNSTIIIVFGSTQPTHLNTKILQASFIIQKPVRPEINDVTQKFPKNQLWWTNCPLHNDPNPLYKLCTTKFEMTVHL
jgi:hypothetical protein